jgi:anti-sigma factor RsiW
VSCSRVRRELLEHFRFPQELGSRSGPHLAHLESCAACREEVGINRELVEQLRRALRERVEGSDPSAASWDLVRRRTVERPPTPWTMRVVRWGSLLPAAVAGILMLATVSETGLFDGSGAPGPVTTSAEQALPRVERATGGQLPKNKYPQAPRGVAELPNGSEGVAWSFEEMPPIVRPIQ